ncbi:hypothetical protein [Dermatobacter hominis]|uniref:hypothetical protein n=1 Tax=Dermatobacter hominis TaxID=2884263 RepID=UPI001D115272|nr:hypothetical protein [Dermatobacter hominis]UDY35439.1 hypothetical protein LH044_19180 [Dermatobacter hominis]
MLRHARTALVPLAALVLVATVAACSGGDDEGADGSEKATPTETTPTAVAGTGTDTTARDASDFCSSLGTSGIEDLLGAPPARVTATDTSCTWSQDGGDGTHELAVTMTPHPNDSEAQAAVSGDEDPAPGLGSFAASAISFDDERGEVQVSTGPAVITVTASAPGLTEARLAAATVAMLQG